MQPIELDLLGSVCGGLSFETRIRAFSKANERWTGIINSQGPGAKNLPEAQRMDRIMRTIDAYPWKPDGSPTPLSRLGTYR
jgi:hypothetical protein